MALIVRLVDEIRMGMRTVDVDEIEKLAGIWRTVNSGCTPSEIALLQLRK